MVLVRFDLFCFVLGSSITIFYFSLLLLLTGRFYCMEDMPISFWFFNSISVVVRAIRQNY